MGFSVGSIFKGKGAGGIVGGILGAGIGAMAGNPMLGAQIGGGIGSMIGPSDERLQRREDLYWYNKQNRDAVKFWQMQNAYNTPAEQAKRYLEAGMNPYLVQGTIGDTAGNISVGSVPHRQIRHSKADLSFMRFFQNKQMESAEHQSESEMLRNEYYKLKNIQLADKIERDRKKGGSVLANKVRKDKPMTLSEARLLNKIMSDASEPTSIKGSSVWSALPTLIENIVYKATDKIAESNEQKNPSWKQFFNTSGRRFNPRGV